MSLTLGREGGIAKPLKKRTVGQTNIAHVYGLYTEKVEQQVDMDLNIVVDYGGDSNAD